MNTQEWNNNPISNITNSSLLDLPSPTSISFLWNMGFILGATLALQITTGIILSIIYSANTATAFSNIVIISQDLNSGWATRTIHTNGASLFFILLYIHTARGMYFNSPSNQPIVWISGVTILLLTIATAFLGYVLPWGQISFWGATVITGVLSAIPLVGNTLLTWIWGGPAVDNPTLNRFFSLHFLLPIILSILVITHLILLHENGSSNPSNTSFNNDNINFNPLFSINDLLPVALSTLAIITLISNAPNILGDVENFNVANPLVAPLHIQPEWYFLFAYVILRSIPSNIGGVVALAMSILILPFLINNNTTQTNFNPPNNINFWALVSIILILTWIGGNPVEIPFENIGQVYTLLYFITITTI